MYTNFDAILRLLETNAFDLVTAAIIIPSLIWLGKLIKQEYADYSEGKKLIAHKRDEAHYLDSLRSVADAYASMQR